MRILFVVGAGILPEQRIKRWQMVSKLYAALGRAMQKLGHQVYYYVHPDAYHEDVPPALTWQCEDHQHLPHVLQNFVPEFVFCWNGSSAGDITTATLAQAHGAKMVYSEQGWFPQSSTLYFDMSGCNGKCGTKNRRYPAVSSTEEERFLQQRRTYVEAIGQAHRFATDRFTVVPPDADRPIFVPLQDERDLNIVQDSPFKTMNEFVGYLARTYPSHEFIARPHPKYPDPKLETYDNVRVDKPEQAMFDTLAECGMVMGINSTTLLESALLGYTVVSYGESLATGTGLFHDARPDGPALDIRSLRVDAQASAAVLHHLLCVKQLERDKLGDAATIMRSGMFKELLQNLNWNSIYR